MRIEMSKFWANSLQNGKCSAFSEINKSAEDAITRRWYQDKSRSNGYGQYKLLRAPDASPRILGLCSGAVSAI